LLGLMRRLAAVLAVGILCAGCEGKPKPETQDLHGYTEFHRAAMQNDLAQVEQMLKKWTPPDLTDAEGVTVLHRAARDGQYQLVELLLSYRANPNARTDRGWTPLHLAVLKGRLEVAELLMRYGAEPMLQTPEGQNALLLAVATGDVGLVDEVLRGASMQAERAGKSAVEARREMVNQEDGKGRLPLHLAIDRGFWDVANSLLFAEANPNVPWQDGRRPLNEAVRTGEVEHVTLLLTYGANIAARDGLKDTAYAVAVRNGYADIANLLLRYGAASPK